MNFSIYIYMFKWIYIYVYILYDCLNSILRNCHVHMYSSNGRSEIGFWPVAFSDGSRRWERIHMWNEESSARDLYTKINCEIGVGKLGSRGIAKDRKILESPWASYWYKRNDWNCWQSKNSWIKWANLQPSDQKDLTSRLSFEISRNFPKFPFSEVCEAPLHLGFKKLALRSQSFRGVE